MSKATKKAPDEGRFIYRPYITLRNGKVLWAKDVGKKAWKIPVAGNDNDKK